MAFTDPYTVHDPVTGEPIPEDWGDVIAGNQNDHEGRIVANEAHALDTDDPHEVSKTLPTFYASDFDTLQDWLDAITGSPTGGVGVLGPGTHHLTTELVVGSGNVPVMLLCYGATITGAGAIAGIKVTGGSTNGNRVIHGLKIDHRNNPDATYGFNLEASWNARLYDCIVEANGVSASYAAFRLGNSDPAVGGTGSFWTSLYNCWVRKRSGADPGDIPNGVLLEGNANATRIMGGGLGNCTVGVKVQNQPGNTAVPNSTTIDGLAFEGVGTAVHVESTVASSNIAGLRVVHCRFEAVTTVLSITGITSQPAWPPYFAGNVYIGVPTTLFDNPNGLRVNWLDLGVTPNLGSTASTLYSYALVLKGLSGTTHPFELETMGGNRGLNIKNGSGNVIAQIVWTGTANEARLQGGGVGTLGMRSLKGLSRTLVDANNLRGSVTISDVAITASVSFATAESDAAYFVVAVVSATSGAPAAGSTRCYVTNKATTGFTVNLEVAPGSGNSVTIDWMLVR